MSSTNCPTPEKTAYRNGAAKAALRGMQRQNHDGGRMMVYKCKCGSWHLGHAPAKIRGAAR